MELFDYINDASHLKKNILDGVTEKEEKRYPGFLVTKYFSFLPDSLFVANEVNIRPFMDNKLKHHFFLYGLRKQKRFTKWFKVESDSDLDLIQSVYSCSLTKAKEYLTILTPNQIQILKDTYHHLINTKS